MATPQEANPADAAALPTQSPAIVSETPAPAAAGAPPSIGPAEVAAPPLIEPAKAELPHIEAPSFDLALDAAVKAQAAEMAAAAHEAAEEPVADAGSRTAAPAPGRSSRFAMLAATVALAAALGAVAGSLSASGVTHLWQAAPVKSGMEASALQATKAELAELSALKANLDGATRNTSSQFAKLADRLDHVERAQLEPAVKLAHIADAVDRLEKKNATLAAAPAAAETTGTIANNQAPAPAEAKLPEKILQNWVVQDVRGGHALVESRYGGVFDVAAGSVIPGLGRVESIKRQDGQWVVVTARGVIGEH
jgi:hypothetical protein